MSEKITVKEQEKKYPPLWPRYVIELVGVILIYLLTRSTVDFGGLNQRGLAIAKQIIMHHRGNLTVSSTTYNGTTFTVYLPIKQK